MGQTRPSLDPSHGNPSSCCSPLPPCCFHHGSSSSPCVLWCYQWSPSCTCWAPPSSTPAWLPHCGTCQAWACVHWIQPSTSAPSSIRWTCGHCTQEWVEGRKCQNL